MKAAEARKNSGRSLLGCALMLAVGWGATPLLAGPGTGTTAVAQAADNRHEIGAVGRKKLTQIYDRLGRIDAPGVKDYASEAIADARQQLDGMTDAEVAEVMVDLEPQLDRMLEVLADLQAIVDGSGRAGLPSTLAAPDFPNAAYPVHTTTTTETAMTDAPGADCEPDPDADPPGGNCNTPQQSSTSSVALAMSWQCRMPDGSPKVDRSTVDEAYRSLIAVITAEAIRDIARRICSQEISFFFAGGNVSVLCIPTDLIYLFAKSIYSSLSLCDFFIDEAEIFGSYSRLEHVHDDLTTHQTALTTHDNTVFNALGATETALTTRVGTAETALTNEIDLHDTEVKAALGTHDTEVKTALGTHDADIKALLAARRAFTLRLEIEEALISRERDAVYYLPEAQGGNLNTVRGIVVQAIGNVVASGETTNAANNYLAQADAHIAAGRFKQAFSLLSSAYFETVKIIGERQ